MRKFEFLDIKVNEDWKVTYNTLTHLNPEDGNFTQEEFEYYILGNLTESLLQIKSKFYFIDLGWYPDGEIDGEFRLRLLPVHKENDVIWDKPIYELKTRSLEKVLLAIEIITSTMNIEHFKVNPRWT